MKTKHLRNLLLLIVITLCYAACEVEFDPNSEWKESTIVYCLLDQDTDTTFVRVEKAFLGEGNYLEFAKIKDSIYYKEGDIDVKLLAYNTWDMNNPVETISFIYTTASKPEGEFYNDSVVPVYYAITQNKIKTNRIYKLEARNVKSGNVVYSSTQPLGDYSIEKPENNIFTFKFEDNAWKMDIQWKNKNQTATGTMPKMFQPVFRFYYKENNIEQFVDLPMGRVVNTYSSSHSLHYVATLDGILNAIKSHINNGQPKQWTDRLNWLELFVTSCDVMMYDYININNPNNDLLTDKPLFTNIENGIGLFASRRTKVKIVFTDYRPEAYNKFINGLTVLNIGF